MQLFMMSRFKGLKQSKKIILIDVIFFYLNVVFNVKVINHFICTHVIYYHL